MNLHIKNKFELVDLVKFGTQARKYVKPYVMFSDSSNGIFKDGDMLDANATYNLSKHLVDNAVAEIQSQILKHVVLTQEEYDALETYEPNTIYLIIEQTEETEQSL